MSICLANNFARKRRGKTEAFYLSLVGPSYSVLLHTGSVTHWVTAHVNNAASPGSTWRPWRNADAQRVTHALWGEPRFGAPPSGDAARARAPICYCSPPGLESSVRGSFSAARVVRGAAAPVPRWDGVRTGSVDTGCHSRPRLQWAHCREQQACPPDTRVKSPPAIVSHCRWKSKLELPPSPKVGPWSAGQGQAVSHPDSFAWRAPLVLDARLVDAGAGRR